MLWLLMCGIMLNTLGLGVIIFNQFSRCRSVKLQVEEYFNNDLSIVSLDVFKAILSYSLSDSKDKNKLVIISFDLTDLTNLTSLLGEEDGETLLKESIQRIKSCTRSSDLITRVGNDSLLIYLPRLSSLKDIEKVAQRLLGLFSSPLILRERELVITPYIGISVCPDNSSNVDMLIKYAESARLKAKLNTTSSYFFYNDELNKKVKETDILVSELKTAIQMNQFELHYQPLYSLTDDEVIGVEALVRWNHPEKGLVPPNEFIPLAESSGLIVPLGYWVLRTACNQYKSWGITNLKLSVNLSAYQFKQKDLVKRIKEIIEQEGLDPSLLNLEITESTSMVDVDYTIKVLTEFRSMGVMISIDDFGTGYSSLAYLKQLPITTLKIDRSFINDIQTQNSQFLIETIINLGRSMGLRVVAEGVETEEQVEVLRSLTCDDIQGFLLSPPVPSNEIEKNLKNGSLQLH